MMIPLLHQGMILAGIPYSEAALSSTSRGGTPYGSSHIESKTLSEDEIKICRAQGNRLAILASRLLAKKT